MDDLQTSDPADVSALRALDQSAYPWFAVDTLLLELMSATPGCAASAFVCSSNGLRSVEFERAKSKGLASVVAPLFEVVAMPPDRVAAFRANLGDSSMLDALPPVKVEPPARPVQVEAYRDGVEHRSFRGRHSYECEKWVMPPDCRVEYRLKLSSNVPEYAKVASVEAVVLVHDLPARIVRLDSGDELLLAPDRSLMTQVREVSAEIIDQLVG